MNDLDDVVIYASSSYQELADTLSAELGAPRGDIECRAFPDGETYHRVLTRPDGQHCVLVGGTISDEETLEIYDLASGLVVGGARRLTLVIPFLGYSTMERAVKRGEVVKGKTRARLLSSIPIAAEGNRALLLDLHAEGLPYYFEGSLNARHAYAKPLILEAIQDLAEDFVLGCTDSGRAKWVESLALELGVPMAVVLKRRDEHGTVVSGINADVKDRTVVIYDDMIRTGGSLLGAAQVYRNAGARRVCAVCTHGLFPGEALAKLKDSGLLEKIVCTNSHPRAVDSAGEFLDVRCVGRLLAQRLKEVH
ncbi:MAG: ribose-phosphate diphosphokinase [Myxococcota bacterium]